MTNKKIGNDSENDLCALLSSKGWLCHRMAPNEAGQQPCDVVAIKNGEGVLIDVKHCDKPFLATSRIEPNQQSCFDYAESLGNKCGFMCHYEGKFYWLNWAAVDMSKPSQPLSLMEEMRK